MYIYTCAVDLVKDFGCGSRLLGRYISPQHPPTPTTATTTPITNTQAPIAFEGEPVMSGIDDRFLQQAGLVYLGSYPSGADTVHCWSRPDLPWPAERLEQWP